MVDRLHDLISDITPHLHSTLIPLNLKADRSMVTYQIISFRKEVSGNRSFAIHLAPNRVLIQCFLQILISSIRQIVPYLCIAFLLSFLKLQCHGYIC